MLLPMMNPANGRRLFAEKGCVVCHKVNGVGGDVAPPLDAERWDLPMTPFEIAARIWDGAEAMIALQQDTLGEQIELNGQELADIIAFLHDPAEQATFSLDDAPEPIRALVPAGN
jgi:mono/diheme cytochrome c family protein